MIRHLMQQLAAQDQMPPAIQQAFTAVDRVFPHWRLPQSNLANPPRVDPADTTELVCTVSVTCPVCQLPQTLRVVSTDELRGLADDLATFHRSGLCAHDQDAAVTHAPV